ncbi:MAG: Re/Si-specific NAD(P)(+) transhydrogenase subunit alpha [SAR324 cluster bacterium]|nr:Re/Si-specific NAD(P)(+) transhydrogenase subunit alpha [SAR324 cluster bacterium]MBL7035243.1 Re/Si-specific NAD(P)(+) transhydrogenase subunit alpha [SAR324 cluster bacterium]
MIIGVLKEIHQGERRVAMAPSVVKQCLKKGHTILMEVGAGVVANFTDGQYEDSGAEIVESAEEIWKKANIILKIRPPEEDQETGVHEADLLQKDSCIICLLNPGRNTELLKRLAKTGGTAIAVDAIPRISRAQSMDVLSSMANISGYRAVTEAAHHFGRLFTGQITAAGKIPPAKVLVIGAGVAGLSAAGSAQSLGAIVRAFDTRSAVREEVQSMGAEFLSLDFKEDGAGGGGYAKTMSKEFIAAEMELFAAQSKEVNIIITTAAIPGKKSPVLITKEMVESMIPGSVIVDLAAEGGGNCEMTKPGETTVYKKVTIIGLTDLPSRLPTQASQLFSNNTAKLIQHLNHDGELKLDFDDEITSAITVVHDGNIVWDPEKQNKVQAKPVKLAEPETVPAKPTVLPETTKKNWSLLKMIGWFLAFTLTALIGFGGSSEFISHITVFVMACFVGYLLIWNVSPSLHTPLMSVTNAISGIIVIGGMIHLSGEQILLPAIAVLISTINIVGGFMVTHRMLEMFRK